MDNISKRIEKEKDSEDIIEEAKKLKEALQKVEKTLYQTKNRSRQDPLNYPIRLTNKLAHLNSLNGMGDFRPTEQSYGVKNELTKEINKQLEIYQKIIDTELPAFNELIKSKGVNAVLLKPSS